MTTVYADSIDTTHNGTTRPAAACAPAGWHDGLDTTYSECWREGHSPTPSSIVDFILATFPATVATDVTPFARLALYLDAGAIDSTRHLNFEMDDAADTGSPFIGWFRPFTSGGVVPSTGTIYETNTWYWEDQYGGSDKTRLLSVLAAGNLTMRVPPPTLPSGWTPGMLWGLFVYEFALNVIPPSRPQQRLYPRAAKGGVGPGRLWPSPETRRIAGGYH